MESWIRIARELQGLAQTGLHFATDLYDRERYERLREIAATMLSEKSNVEAGEVLEWNKREFGYATPKVDVRAFIPRGDEVLLIRETADQGRWTLPGGWADINESPSESVIREAQEETGYLIRVHRLLAVYDRERQGHVPAFPYHVYKMFFLCEIVGGTAAANAESSESAFFGRQELPELSVTRVKASQIQRFFEMVGGGEERADFD